MPGGLARHECGAPGGTLCLLLALLDPAGALGHTCFGGAVFVPGGNWPGGVASPELVMCPLGPGAVASRGLTTARGQVPDGGTGVSCMAVDHERRAPMPGGVVICHGWLGPLTDINSHAPGAACCH